MPKLNCSADACQYNQSGLCSAGVISVFGRNAQRSSRTCCSTFVPQNGAITNNVQQGVETIQIGCNVNTCAYNRSVSCHAPFVDISGVQASISSETDCSSFSKK